MAIQVRRGKEADFDPSKMLPGEWAVSLDTRYVRMCFAPGIVLRMATYEAFEADTQKFIQQMESILSETKTAQEAVERIQSEIKDSVVTVENYVNSAKDYSDLSNTYAMQSKQYAEESSGYADDAYEEAERAKMYAENASAVTGVNIATKDVAGIIKGGENHIAEDGTLTLTARTTGSALLNSHAGSIVIENIAGAVEQNGTPTPDAPIEIKNAEIGEIKTHNRNFIPYPYQYGNSYTNNGITYDIDSNGVITLNGTATNRSSYSLISTINLIPLEDGETYTIWCERVNDDGATLFFRHYYEDSNGIVTSGNHTSALVWKVIGSESVRRLGIAVGVYNTGETCNNAKIKIMIVKGLYGFEDLEYKPYLSSTVTLSKTYTLNSIDGFHDRFIRKDGVWKLERNVFEFVMDGTNFPFEGKMSSTMTNGYYAGHLPKGKVVNVTKYPTLCSHFKRVGVDAIDKPVIGATMNGTTFEVSFGPDTDITTLTKANEWLKNNNMHCMYVLDTPTYEDLSTEDQIALNSLVSYDEVTHVTTDSGLQPILYLEYGTSHVGAIALDAWNTAKRNEIKNAKLVELTNSIATALV